MSFVGVLALLAGGLCLGQRVAVLAQETPAKTEAPAEKEKQVEPKKAEEKAPLEKAPEEKKTDEKAAPKAEPGKESPPLAPTPLKHVKPFETPEGAPAPDESASPNLPSARKVVIGVYVNQIHSVSLKENNFTVDFWLWFRWDGDDAELDPTKTFEVIDGRVEDDGGEFIRKKLADGSNYAAKRCTYTITQFWDVAKFPLDDHRPVIAIEDSENEDDKVQFVADKDNCDVSPRVRVPGWGQGTHSWTVNRHTYRSNYGDTDLGTGKESHYSRFAFQIELKREGWGYFWKLFAGLFTATMIAMLVFFIKPTQVDPRFGLGAGAIFAAVASEYIVTSSLPDTSVLTMADVLHIISFVFIFASIAESTYSLALDLTEDPELCAKSKLVDRISAVVMGLGYIGLCAAVVFNW